MKYVFLSCIFLLNSVLAYSECRFENIKILDFDESKYPMQARTKIFSIELQSYHLTLEFPKKAFSKYYEDNGSVQKLEYAFYNKRNIILILDNNRDHCDKAGNFIPRRVFGKNILKLDSSDIKAVLLKD